MWTRSVSLATFHFALLQVDKGVNLCGIAKRTENYSCYDIRCLCRDAAMKSLRRLLTQNADANETRREKEDFVKV